MGRLVLRLLALAALLALLLLPPAALASSGATHTLLDEDDDGFDAIPAQVELPKQPEEPVRPAAAAAAATATVPAKKDSYAWEMLGLALGVGFLINWFLGRRANAQLAERWAAMLQPELRAQFARLGQFTLPDGQLVNPRSAHADPRPGDLLLKDSAHQWQLYASGRRHCKGALLGLELRRRQDLFGGRLLGWLDNTNFDQMTVEIPLDAGMDPQVILLAPRRSLRRMRRERPDAEALTLPVASPMIPARLGLLAESKAGALQLLSEVEAELQDLGHLLLELHVSDRCAKPGLPLALDELPGAPVAAAAGAPTVQRVLRARLRLPPASQGVQALQAELLPWVRGLLRLVDALAEQRLGRTERAQADKHRALLEAEQQKLEQSQRQEELARRREEQRNQQPELTPAQIRKREEKELKKQRKAKVKILR